MVLSPAATWAVYMGGIGLVLVICAAAADIWGAKVERKLRDQARAEARAQRREERELSIADGQELL